MAGRFFAVAIALCCLGLFPLAADAEGFEFAFNGVRLNGALLGGIPLPTGADLEARLPIAGDKLLFTLRLAGGYEDRLILRDLSDGSPIAKPAFDNAQWFNWPNLETDAGLVYRLARGKNSPEAPRIEVFGLARLRYEQNSPGLGTAYFPDARELFALSFIGGMGVDGVYKSPRRYRSGYAGELSFEYAPASLGFSGGTDFYRASAAMEAYLPILSLGTSDIEAVSIYAAAYLAGDYAGGTNIPLYVLTGFGGRQPRDGIGNSIRGYQSWGYEATTKAEASFELRFVGPGLFGLANLRPMAYAFGDLGYFDGLYKCPIVDKNGLIMSAGAGIALNILDFAYLGLRAGYKFPVDDPLYAYYFPGGEKFFWSVSFLLHF